MPTTRKSIVKQMRALGIDSIFGAKREIKYLPEILSQDERIVSMVSGRMDRSIWLVVCTTKRVIFLDKGIFFGLKQSEIPLQKINSIEQSTGVMYGTITVWYGSSNLIMNYIKNDHIRHFVNCANKAIEDSEANSLERSRAAATPAVPQNNSEEQLQNAVSNELIKLAKLKEQGVLTEEEFNIQKAKLLAA